MRITFLVLSVILLCYNSIAFAQLTNTITWYWYENGNSNTHKVIEENIDSKDSIKVFDNTQKVKNEWIMQGYIAASIDSIIYNKEGIKIYYYKGERYTAIMIENGESIPVRPVKLNTYIDLVRWRDYFSELLVYYQNHGYPYINVGWSNITINRDTIRGIIYIDKMKLVRIDSVSNIGSGKISNHYLKEYLGYRNGELYNQKKLERYKKLAKQISFLQQISPPQIAIRSNIVNLELNLKRRTANKFNFLLAVLPNSNYNNRLEVTGEGSLLLKNTFRQGETISCSFTKITRASSKLELYTEYPYLPGLPIGVDAKLEIIKRDSSFVDRMYQAGLRIGLHGENFINVQYRNKLSTVLRIDTVAILISKRLPKLLDYHFKGIAIHGIVSTLDDALLPSAGYWARFDIESGFKTIKRNSLITSLSRNGYDYENLYDSIPARYNQINCTGQLVKYSKLFRRQILKCGIQGGLKYAENIFQNEGYRIGGMHTLRGFDEEYLEALWYSIGTLEYQILIGAYSNIYLFYDIGIYGQDQKKYNYIYDKPMGVGAGINIETKAGVFSMAYALGKLSNTHFQFRSAKIHIGYINYF